MAEVLRYSSVATVAPLFCLENQFLLKRIAKSELAQECRHTGFQTLQNTERYIWQRSNQHCANSFGKGLEESDVYLYEKVPHSRLSKISIRYSIGWTNFNLLSNTYALKTSPSPAPQPPCAHLPITSPTTPSICRGCENSCCPHQSLCHRGLILPR